ncbi:hypothetical protein OPV22_007917 [Ensete ventricosum]|uniref:Secreted protein n=1 Tax=Ensete ventricosum TaxID=4639 RepID=A0AAV8PN45_ENSVE|nr:hypothetical protein OPV22_007917 [Ensete ventricosum]
MPQHQILHGVLIRALAGGIPRSPCCFSPVPSLDGTKLLLFLSSDAYPSLFESTNIPRCTSLTSVIGNEGLASPGMGALVSSSIDALPMMGSVSSGQFAHVGTMHLPGVGSLLSANSMRIMATARSTGA